jgi:hypothetical protein
MVVVICIRDAAATASLASKLPAFASICDTRTCGFALRMLWVGPSGWPLNRNPADLVSVAAMLPYTSGVLLEWRRPRSDCGPQSGRPNNCEKRRQPVDREATRERVRADMEADFLPAPSPDTLSQGDRRLVNAAEYIAYHLGQIDKKIDRLIVLLERSAQTK